MLSSLALWVADLYYPIVISYWLDLLALTFADIPNTYTRLSLFSHLPRNSSSFLGYLYLEDDLGYVFFK